MGVLNLGQNDGVEPFIADELRKLAALREDGIISQAEFEAQKARLLSDEASQTAPQTAVIQSTPGRRILSASTVPAASFTIIGGVIAGVSSFLPWVSGTGPFLSISRNAYELGANDGFSIEGIIVVVLGAIAIIIGIVWLTDTDLPSSLLRFPSFPRLTESEASRYLQLSPFVLGVAIAAVAGIGIPSINGLVHRVQDNCQGACTASMGYGVYAAFVGAGFMIVAALVLHSELGASHPELFEADGKGEDRDMGEPVSSMTLVEWRLLNRQPKVMPESGPRACVFGACALKAVPTNEQYCEHCGRETRLIPVTDT